MTATEAPSARGKRILQILAKAGADAGLEVRTEYPVVGGRIDLVWLWKGPETFPSELPLVGFEIESSWRTRKHIKGDYLNLLDLQPALGIIVLLGEDDEVESTRKFARAMIDRHPGRMLIWSERDVLRLGAAKGPEEVADLLAEAAPADEDVLMKEPRLGAGKYRALVSWLGSQVHDRVDATFAQIEEILGFPLPSSARTHRPYWAAGQPGGLGRAIADAGWRTRNVNMTAERLTFERARS